VGNIFDELAANGEAEDLGEQEEDAPAVAHSPISETPDDQASYTPIQLRECSQELLRVGLLEASAKPNLYRVALTQTAALNTIFEPFDLALRIDEIRALAFLIVPQRVFAEGESEWSHPLVRKQRLTLEQSLLLALLRQQYVVYEQEAGIGGGDAKVALEELMPQLQLFLGALGSDQREDTRLRTLLEQLRAHGVVSEISKHDQVSIRPIIAHLANPENLVSLLQALKAKSRSAQEGSAIESEGMNHDDA